MILLCRFVLIFSLLLLILIKLVIVSLFLRLLLQILPRSQPFLIQHLQVLSFFFVIVHSLFKEAPFHVYSFSCFSCNLCLTFLNHQVHLYISLFQISHQISFSNVLFLKKAKEILLNDRRLHYQVLHLKLPLREEPIYPYLHSFYLQKLNCHAHLYLLIMLQFS